MSLESDSNHYARDYRISLAWRILFLLMGPVLVVGFGFLIVSDWSRWANQGLWTALMLTTVLILMMGFGAYALICPFVHKITLHPDWLKVTDITTARTLLRSEIRGYRIQKGGGAVALVLYPRDEKAKPLKTALIVKTDLAFWEWITQLPDLNEEDLRESEEKILDDFDVGPTPQERAERLRNAKRKAKIFNWAGGGIFVWGLFYPEPYEIVIALMILVPLFAIRVARVPGLYEIEGEPNDARASLATPFFLGGLLLGLRALLDIQLLRWQSIIIWVVIGAIGITALMAKSKSLSPEAPLVAGSITFCDEWLLGRDSRRDQRFDGPIRSRGFRSDCVRQAIDYREEDRLLHQS